MSNSPSNAANVTYMAILQEGARTKGKLRKERKRAGTRSRGQRHLTRNLGFMDPSLPPSRMFPRKKAKKIGMSS